MKKITGFIALACITVTLNAQTPNISWSRNYDKLAPAIDVSVLGYAAEGYYVVNKKPPSGMAFSPTITVEYFNNKNEKAFTKEVTPEKIEDFVNVVYFNNAVCLIKSLFTKDAGKNVLTATPIQRDGTQGKPIEIASLAAEKMGNRGRFEVAASPNGKKLLVLAMPNYTKDANEQIGVTLYEGAFTKLWSADQTFTYAWTRAVENKPLVNDNGTAFILKKTDMKGDDNTWSIFVTDGKAMKETKIALDGNKKIHTIVSAFSPSGELAVGGYYTEEKKVHFGMGTALHGSFLYKMDASGSAAKITAVNPFDKRKDIVAKDIVFHQNKTLLLGEWYYINSKSAPVPGDAFAMEYTYSGLSILIDGYDEAGKFLYSATVKKDNRSVNDKGAWVSYFAAVIKDKLHIVFNDDRHKYDGKKNIIVIGETKIVVHTTVDLATGAAAEPEPVPNTGPVGGKGSEMLLRSDVFLRAGDNTYIIRAENREGYRMGIAVF